MSNVLRIVASNWILIALPLGVVVVAVVPSVLFPSTFWHPGNDPLVANDARCKDPEVLKVDRGFFYDYYWRPVLCDQGYNLVNTLSYVALGILVLPFAYRILVAFQAPIGIGLVLAILPLAAWMGVVRALSDADLFSPFSYDTAVSLQEHGLGYRYLDAIFAVPLFQDLGAAFGLMCFAFSLQAHRVGQALGNGRALEFYGLGLILLGLPLLWMWSSRTAYLQGTVGPLVIVASVIAAFGIVAYHSRREGRFSPNAGVFGHGLVLFLVAMSYVVAWTLGFGVGNWQPPAALTQVGARGWIILATFCGPAIFIAGLVQVSKRLVRRKADARQKLRVSPRIPVRIPLVFVGLLLVVALAALLSALAVGQAAAWFLPGGERPTPAQLMPVAVNLSAGPIAVVVAATTSQKFGSVVPLSTNGLAAFSSPVNLVLAFSQMADAFATGLGSDFFGYREGQFFVAATLQQVRGMDLAPLYGAYPTSVTLLVAKFAIVLLVIYILDFRVRNDFPGRDSAVGAVKILVICLGFIPAIRNSCRAAMGV